MSNRASSLCEHLRRGSSVTVELLLLDVVEGREYDVRKGSPKEKLRIRRHLGINIDDIHGTPNGIELLYTEEGVDQYPTYGTLN